MGLISTTLPNLIGGVSQQPYPIRMASQCEAMENCMPSVVEFLRRRPASKHIARIINSKVNDASVHVIDRDATEQYVVVVTNGDLQVFDLLGEKKSVSFPNGKAYLNTATPSTQISHMTINDYTFILNKSVTVRESANKTATRTPEALVFIKQASYASTYTVSLDGVDYSHTTYKDDNRRGSDGLEYTKENFGEDKMKDSKFLDANRYVLSSSTIAGELEKHINASGLYDLKIVKSSLWIRRKDKTAFKAQVSDSRSNTQISITTDRVQRFSDLPLVAPNGYVTEITGGQSSSFDNYYVRFETNDGGSMDSGVWVETVKPGISDRVDAATMPHALVREADGTFSFKPLTWTPRKCGDLDSAPTPTFVGRTISAVFFYRNRLGFLAGENCVLSEAGQFFNFYVSTVTTIVDSDVIDVAASHTKAAVLHHAAAFSEGLLLFSDTTQFLLEHDDTLSVKTCSIKPITEFECSVKAAPVGAGKTIFFATGRGDWAGVREYFVEEDSSLTDANDISAHIPHYIPGQIHKLVCSSNEDCLLALSDRERRTISLYKYYWNNREKLQSSWSRWTFSGEVLSAAFLSSLLILVMQYDDGVYLEMMHLEPGYTDPGATFEYNLDRKVNEKSITVTHNANAKTSTITFPYKLPAAPCIVSRHAFDGEEEILPPGVNFEVLSWSGSTATVNGEVRGLLMAGVPYTSLMEFSRQILREDSGSGKLAVVEGRLQLRNMTLTYGETGYFAVEVTPEYRQTDRRIFTGQILGHGSNLIGRLPTPSGTFRFPILSQAEAVTIRLVSDSFLPFRITSAGWEGFYHIRSRRV